MRILMAFTAGMRSLAEIDMEECALHVWRLVAIGAFHGAMRTQKRELRRRVIESVHIVPILCGVAGLASDKFACGVLLLHPFGKLTVMNVFVASAATELGEMVEYNRVGRSRLVAIVAGYGEMASCQRKTALLVPVNGEVRCLPFGAVVALFTAVLPWVGCELPLVFIRMAISAQRKLDLVFCVLAGRLVAIRAFYVSMRHHQRELCFGVVRCCVRGRAPALHGMAALAPALVRTLRKLPLMLVLVAIRAGFERNLGLEVSALVAGDA